MRTTVLPLLAILATFLGGGSGICVMDNKKGWSVHCGLRDSYLLRLKDYGGIKANFDFGFGLGDEEGFPESIKNTNKGPYHKRKDENVDSQEIYQEIPQGLPPVGAYPAAARRTSNGEAARRTSSNEALRPQHRRRIVGNRIPVPFGLPTGLVPPPLRPIHRQDQGSSPQFGQPFRGHPQNNVKSHTQQFFIQPGTSPNIVVTHVPAPRPTPSPTAKATVGPAIGELLKMDASTPADTDHVPSFAAKTFIVREAPEEFYPVGYKAPNLFPKFSKQVEVPRTKFFCEEQKYLPGIYADVQLGCKVFHLCMPAAMGNTLTSFLCPNMTLFDQSIMQCNHWYHVDCESSVSHYDANLHMALSYRKMNAALLPLTAVRNFNNVALLNHNSEEMKSHQVVPPADPSIAENLALKRIGEADVVDGTQRAADSEDDLPEIPRGPRKLSFEEEEEEPSSEGVEDENKRRKRSTSDGDPTQKTFFNSPLLLKLRGA